MSAIVLLVNGKADLLLDDVVRDDSGEISQAEVINGAWTLKVKNGVAASYAGEYSRNPVHSWPKPDWREVVVPASVRGDYDEIMRWAEENA